MSSILYERIKGLCSKKEITISKLESDLGFGNSSINKWGVSMPGIDKIKKVADYFNVSTDYLLGRVDIESTISDLFVDKDIISFQRARQNMTPTDKKKSMQMLKLGFEYAFKDQEDNDND